EPEMSYLRPPPARSAVKKALASMVEEGSLTPIAVEGRDTLNYARQEDLESSTAAHEAGPAVRLLSPFDNVVIQRRRLRDLWNFDYVIECYTPGPKRKHGYFSLPILWGDRFVGRLDPKAHREKGLLEVRSLHFEKGFRPDSAFKAAFEAELERFAAFNGCSRLKVQKR
ncbi:MAG TPA: crosslink repair DNA glycosylase YcaQ family protein, partial [Bdellovibrionota bacterium]|nr:crosslink repair DNA glycosylase YcaQ family protein [Bdellovibrionota bacterium]